MNFAERAARNEEVVRDVNQQIEEGAKRHGVDSAMPLHCECGQATCFEKVELSPSRYEQILANRYRFIVAPGHEQAEVERVVEEYESFFIVEKIYVGLRVTDGPWALATSAYSNVLDQFAGGPGQIALHGVVGLRAPLGTFASHGCIRFGNAAITWIATHVDNGTPVLVTA